MDLTISQIAEAKLNQALHLIFCMFNNPLKEQSRYQAAPVLSPNQEVSLLDWLEAKIVS